MRDIFKMGIVSSEYDRNDKLIQNHLGSNEVVINFHRPSLILIHELAPTLERHLLFRELINQYQGIEIPYFKNEFEQKLAMLIVLNIIEKRQCKNICSISSYDVIVEVNSILMDIINKACNPITIEDESIPHLLDGYPLSLLSEVCKAKKYHVHIVAESVKRFITIRKKYHFLLPTELYNVIDGLIPLIGDDKSPLTKRELEAIYRYLGSRKNIYVHILLNCLFEISRCIGDLTNMEEIQDRLIIAEENLLTITKSSWLFLLLWTSSYFRESNQIDNYEADTESYENCPEFHDELFLVMN